MRWRPIHEAARGRTFVLVFDKGEDPFQGLERFAEQEGVEAAQITAIGAFDRVELGYFDGHGMDYLRQSFSEQLEVLSLVGDIAMSDGRPSAHCHVVLGRRDFTTIGGHLFAASVWPTLEAVVTGFPHRLVKRKDEETGLTVIDLR